MYLNVQGLVLRVTDYKDRDAILTVLTRERGRITVKARGIRRRNNPMSVACQLLSLTEFTIFEYRDQFVINDAHVVELFQGLRMDIQKLALATYFSQVAELVSQEDMPNPELLPLVLNSLYGLSNLDISESKVKAVFELRCACLAGFMPDLSGCAGCMREEAELFDISTGTLICHRCRSNFPSGGIRLPVSAGILAAMRYICSCDPKRIFGFTLGVDAMDGLSQVTEAFLATQLERGFSSLDFYKSLLI